MKPSILRLLPLLVAAPPLPAAVTPTAENTVRVDLPPHRFAGALLPESPFGINTAFHPDTPDLDARLEAMQLAGIKWVRNDAFGPDVYGTKRFVPYDKVRTSHLPVPLGESPIYIIGPKGTKATVRPDPGW